MLGETEMKVLKILLLNLKSNVFRTIISLVFVTISVMLMNVTLSRFMYMKYINNLVIKSGLFYNYMYIASPSKTSYYMNNSESSTDLVNKANEYVAVQLSELKLDEAIENYYSISSFGAPISNNMDDRAKFVCYPRSFAYEICFPVSNGIWFNEYDFNNDLVPVVVGSDFSGRFKIGETIEFSFLNFKAIVIGILERNSLILTSGATGNGIDLNSCFDLGNNKIIICGNWDRSSSKATIVKTCSKDSESSEQSVFNAISDISYTFTFKDLAQHAYEDNRLITEMQTIIFVLMMAVCIAGVSNGNLLATIYQRKKYSVYFLCGMDWKRGILITAVEGILKLIVPAIVGYIMFISFCIKEDYYGLRVTTANVWLSLLLLVAIFMLTTLKPLSNIKNTSPTKIIGKT